ncbi:MAG: peptide ABC transporter substrate-binding protein, partial [Stomatobaculum longum]|nr:peptide ABC transporter substrate-binding protein [Stomatobaculum longum]
MENIEEKALTPLVHNEENILEVNGLKKYFPIKGGFFNSVVGQVKA